MQNSTSILVVEENPDSLRQVTDILNLLGYDDLQGTTSGLEALTLLRMKKFGCVFSTWEMQEMTGLALLKILRNDEKFFELPFFLAGDSLTKAKVIQAGQARATGLIVKPYQSKVIKEKVTTMGNPQPSFIPVETQAACDTAVEMVERGEYEEALEEFNKLLHEGESAEIYYNIGYIKTAQGKFPESIEAFRKATQLDRLFAKAHEGMGRALKALGRDEEAEACLNKAAEIYMSSNNEEKTQEILDEIMQEDPQSVNVFNTQGVLHRKKGEYVEALKCYHRALRIHPEEPYIYYNIGNLYVELKDLKKGKEYFEKALRFDPYFKEARDAVNILEGKSI